VLAAVVPRLTFERVAIPLPFVVALPTDDPFSVKLIDLLPTPDAPAVSVAVRFTVPPNVPVAVSTAKVVACAAVTVTASVSELLAWVELPEYVAVTVCVPVPTAEGVYVTEHALCVGLPDPGRVHVVELNVPAPLLLNVTVPAGAEDEPPVCVSATSALHDVEALSETELGVHVSVVVVARLRLRVPGPLTDPPVSEPPAVTVKEVVPTGVVPWIVVIDRDDVCGLPLPVNVEGVNVPDAPLGKPLTE
jgi:hypothetical protein